MAFQVILSYFKLLQISSFLSIFCLLVKLVCIKTSEPLIHGSNCTDPASPDPSSKLHQLRKYKWKVFLIKSDAIQTALNDGDYDIDSSVLCKKAVFQTGKRNIFKHSFCIPCVSHYSDHVSRVTCSV